MNAYEVVAFIASGWAAASVAVAPLIGRTLAALETAARPVGRQGEQHPDDAVVMSNEARQRIRAELVTAAQTTET